MTTNNRRGGFYFLDNKPLVSVTEAINILEKKSLTYWFGQQVYFSMVKNPNLSEKEALSAPYKTSEKAKDRGKTIHSLVESWKVTQTEIDNVPELYKGYAQAFYNFIKQTDIIPIEHEKTVYSLKYGYAGTLDLLAKREDKTIILDVKTSKDGNIYKEVELQVSAYQQALEEQGTKIDEVYALALAQNGTFTLKQVNYEFNAFLNCLAIWKWQNKDKCEKVGYDY